MHNENVFRDIFDFMQPRARLLDLIRIYATNVGLLLQDYFPPERSELAAAPNISRRTAIDYKTLSINFSPRHVVLSISAGSSKQTIARVARDRLEPLEHTASRLVAELQSWIVLR